MRIGLFTDTYLPTINGIVYVAESLRDHLESLGHEVYVLCPSGTLRQSRVEDQIEESGRIIKFPSVKGLFYDEQNTSLFFAPYMLRKIAALDLDVIHVLTPSQIGMLGVGASNKFDIPLVIQHTTDLYEFVEDYPSAIPAVFILSSVVMPMSISLNSVDVRELLRSCKPSRHPVRWSQDIIEKAITIAYSRADVVISQSKKTTKQLCSWQSHEGYHYPIVLLPNGVDALPKPKAGQVEAFKHQYGIDPKDKLFGFVGRLGKEKNVPLLIDALGHVLVEEPRARLLFVGDFEYREVLENIVRESGHGDRVTFTGALPRQSLGVVYAALDVFAFPSLKDTQGWVLHEAAHAGLPIVLVDKEVTEVVHDGENGFIVDDAPEEMAQRLVQLLRNKKLRAEMGARSAVIARGLTERHQVKKLEALYRKIINARKNYKMISCSEAESVAV